MAEISSWLATAIQAAYDPGVAGDVEGVRRGSEPLAHVSVLQSITALAATNRRVTALAR